MDQRVRPPPGQHPTMPARNATHQRSPFDLTACSFAVVTGPVRSCSIVPRPGKDLLATVSLPPTHPYQLLRGRSVLLAAPAPHLDFAFLAAGHGSKVDVLVFGVILPIELRRSRPY